MPGSLLRTALQFDNCRRQIVHITNYFLWWYEDSSALINSACMSAGQSIFFFLLNYLMLRNSLHELHNQFESRMICNYITEITARCEDARASILFLLEALSRRPPVS